MALVDPTETITTSLNDISYIAGEEPWNKNLDLFNIDTKDTSSNNYQCDWKKWHGVYRKIPEARSTIDVWCRWIIGKKLIMDDKTKKITDRIKGNGKQTFRQILFNLKRISKVGGDAYAEQVRDKAGRLINLKILNPGSIRVDSNSKGIIKKYVQTAKSNFKQIILNEWEPDQIFHVTNDGIADETHGIPELEKTYDIIKWRHQSMSVLSVIFFRYVKPLLFVKANTDDPDELGDLKTKMDNAIKNIENIITPKGAIEGVDRISIPQYSTLDPLPWLIFLRSYFTESSNVPDLIRGKSDEVSLAAGKLNYLGFKEKAIMEQIEFSEVIESQLGLNIEFEIPREIDIEIAKQIEDIEKRNNAKRDKEVVSGRSP